MQCVLELIGRPWVSERSNLAIGCTTREQNAGVGHRAPGSLRAQEDTGLGGGKGAILRAHQKEDFGAIPYFLVIADS